MSLIAWYKLDGDALDSSGNGNNLTTNTATSTTAGKIGGCYTFASGNAISTTSGIDLSHNVSFTAWAYNNNAFAGNMMIFSCNSTLYSGPDLYFSGTISWNTGDGAGNPFKKDGVNVVYPSSNAWHHYAVVNNQELNKTFLYIDGEYYGEATYRNTFQENRGFTIGNYSPGSTGYAWAGMIDDVRIYSHTLSEKEIKELAKAKILHYTFDDFQEPTENLVSNPTKEVISTSNEFMQWGDIAPIFDTYGTSVKYSLSLELKSSIGGPVNVYIQNGSSTKYSFVSQTVITTTFYQRYVFENLTAAISNPADVNAMLTFYGTYGTGRYPAVKNVQIEAKPYATPFVNGTRTGSVSDNSGYDNHADLALATTPQWVEDSRIGSGAYKFDGVDDYISTNTALIPSTVFTLSAWVNHTSANYIGIVEQYQSGINGRFTFRLYQNKIYALLGDSSANYFGSNTLLDQNTWNHVAMVRDSNNDISFYINGIKDVNTYNNSIEINQSLPTKIGGTYQPFDGQIDDVRIYATALSADDVKILYNTRAQIDNRGNFFMHGIIENDDKQIDTLTFGEDELIESSFLVTAE